MLCYLISPSFKSYSVTIFSDFSKSIILALCLHLIYTVFFFNTAGATLPTTIAVSGLKYSRQVSTQ